MSNYDLLVYTTQNIDLYKQYYPLYTYIFSYINATKYCMPIAYIDVL